MMLAQLSGFEVMRLVNELHALDGSFLQKAYEPWKDLLVLRFNTKSGKKALVHRVGEWLYVTDEQELEIVLGGTSELEGQGEAGTDITPFVRVVRDHLSNAFLSSSRQIAFDRIIELEFRRDVPFFLVFEMFGDGNVILRRENIIVGALKTQAWRHRIIKGGKEYRTPPLRKDPRTIDLAELTVLIKESTADIVRTLATSVNLGGTYSEEILVRAGIDKAARAKDLEVDQIKALQDAIHSITSEVAQGSGGVVHSQDGKRAAITAVRLAKFGESPVENFAELGAAIKACHPLLEDQAATADAEGTGLTSELDAHIEKLKHQAKQQEDAMVRFQEEIEAASSKSEAIYINYKSVEDTIEGVKAVRDKSGWPEAVKAFSDLSVDQSQSTITMKLASPDGSGKQLPVILDIRKSVNENAKAYYESIKVVRDKSKGAEVALARTRAELKRLALQRERLLSERSGGSDGAGTVVKRRARRKKFWFESYRWFVSKAGNIIIGGKDASSNHRLVKRHLSEGDRYIHADIHGAPSIVVKSTDHAGKPVAITEATLEESCHYAVCFSKAWSGMLGSGEAYWVNPEQVSTTAQSGEFVPRGGFMIRGKRNYVRNLDLRLGVGLIKLDDVELVMCAPIETVKARTEKFFVVVPSRSKKTDVSKAIAKELGVAVEEVESVLPPGGMDLIPP